MSNVVVSINRSSLPGAPAPLEVSGLEDARDLGLYSYQEPGLVVRLTYMPDSQDVHGSEAIAAAYQQGIISFGVFPRAADEAGAQALIAELRTALGQFSFTVTTTVGNAAPRVWSAVMGSIEPAGGRTLDDLESADPGYVVTIPVYPIAS